MGKLLICVTIAALTLGMGGFVSVAKASITTAYVQAEEKKCEKCGHLPSKPEKDCKCECHKAKH